MNNFNKHLSKSDIESITKKEKTKAKKISTKTLIFRIIEITVACAYLLMLAFGRLFAAVNDSDYYKSMDLFSGAEAPIGIIRSLSIILLVCAASSFLHLFIGKVRAVALSKKGRVALLDLLNNLVKYVTVIIVFCIALSAFGVDTAGIFAGLGIVALIIGLGVTSLIEDIVAGIFIIAERTFDVGDIIVLDGFRGTVLTVGIRSTKIADVGGDILTVRNSSIGSLVNLTDRQSCAALTIPIAPEESLQNVEKIIKESHIENIKDTCDKIIGDPMYLGLCDINAKGVQMLLFIAGCKEDDRYDVERALYHGIKVMLESNGVKLGTPGLMYDDEN